MGLYIYSHPDDESKTVEVYQKMNDKHEYHDENGVKWNRVYLPPQTAIDTKIDPMSARDFVEKTGRKKGSLGSLMDEAKEASLKREKIMGKDFIKDKSIQKWKEQRRRKDGSLPKHPSEIIKQKDIKISL